MVTNHKSNSRLQQFSRCLRSMFSTARIGAVSAARAFRVFAKPHLAVVTPVQVPVLSFASQLMWHPNQFNINPYESTIKSCHKMPNEYKMTLYWYFFVYFYECQISTYMNMLCDKMSWQETDAKFRLKVRVPTARLRGFATGRGDVAGTFADNGLLKRFQEPLKIDEHYWHIEHLFSNHSKTIDFKGPAWTHPWRKVADYWKLQVMRCRWQRQNFTWETHSILSCGILYGCFQK